MKMSVLLLKKQHALFLYVVSQHGYQHRCPNHTHIIGKGNIVSAYLQAEIHNIALPVTVVNLIQGGVVVTQVRH